MKKISKNKRKKLYLDAYDMIDSGEECRICCSLKRSSVIVKDFDSGEDMFDYFMNLFPEFSLFKPEKYTDWWDWDTEYRLNILLFCYHIANNK